MRRCAWMRRVVASGALLVGIWPAAPLFGQLSEQDIEALRERGRREGWTFEVSANPATRVPLEQLCGLVIPEGWEKTAVFDPCTPRRDLPTAFSWRDIGGCTPIRNQGGCGSCWAFGTLAPLESNILIKLGLNVDLSEQWLVSCNREGYGCAGGWWVHDYHQWKPDACGGFGAVPESAFPYVATDAACNCPYPHEYLLNGWAFVESWNVPSVAAMKQAILDYGPIAVAVAADGAFSAYSGGVFNACGATSINHAVALVGWDDQQGANGVWILRNSWGTGWGENGYMRIAYGCNYVGYAATYVNFGDPMPLLGYQYPDGLPSALPPNLEASIRVYVVQRTGTPQPGTAQFWYRVNGGAFQQGTMTQTSPNRYVAVFPARPCGDVVDYYFTAQSTTGGIGSDPVNAPASFRTANVFYGTGVVFGDDCEIDRGWVVGAAGDDATAGIWNRMDPEGTSAQPEDDHTPAPGVACWVTDGVRGGSDGARDVDGGKTTLLSPVLDLSNDPHAVISYWRWYSNDKGASPGADVFVVDITADGSNWVNVETVGPSGAGTTGGWIYHEFRVADYITPTAQVRLRFVASDYGAGSLVEAAIDDLAVSGVLCVPEDQVPPTPNPMTFATPPWALSHTEVRMIASIASDPALPVKYQFECVGGGIGGDTSPWQDARMYYDGGLEPNTAYTYRVRARDNILPPNVTAFSESFTVATLCNVPWGPSLGSATHNSMQIDVYPGNNPDYTALAIYCVSTDPLDPNWQGKFVNAAGGPADAAVWQSDPDWGVVTTQGMAANTFYVFAVKARNLDGIETSYSINVGLRTDLGPRGACCVEMGHCLVDLEAECAALDGVYQGDGSTCTPNPCPQPVGACCLAGGECAVLLEEDCDAAGGLWQGLQTTCEPNPCPQPTGACCMASGLCHVLTAVECSTAGGVYAGNDAACVPNPCPQPCILLGDLNGDGVLDGQDIPGFVRVKLGSPETGDRAACADFGQGDFGGDTAAFVAALLGE